MRLGFNPRPSAPASRQETQPAAKSKSTSLAPPRQQSAAGHRKREKQAQSPGLDLTSMFEDRKESCVAEAEWAVGMVPPQDGED